MPQRLSPSELVLALVEALEGVVPDLSESLELDEE